MLKNNLIKFCMLLLCGLALDPISLLASSRRHGSREERIPKESLFLRARKPYIIKIKRNWACDFFVGNGHCERGSGICIANPTL